MTATTTTSMLISEPTIINRDIALGIPEVADESVDLILTDPPYAREFLPLYGHLAKLAADKLKEGGSVVFYFGQHLLPDILNIFASSYPELKYWWMLAVRHSGHGTRIHDRAVWVEWKPMLWFVKGSGKNPELLDDIHDYIESRAPDKSRHPWAQSRDEAYYIIDKLTVEGSLVLDPFVGSGVFGSASVRLGRQFVGIDINAKYCRLAKSNLIFPRMELLKDGPRLPRQQDMMNYL